MAQPGVCSVSIRMKTSSRGLVAFMLCLLLNYAWTCGPGQFVASRNRRFTAVVRRQPDTLEKSVHASGPFRKALSPKSDLLKKNINDGIVFRNVRGDTRLALEVQS